MCLLFFLQMQGCFCGQNTKDSLIQTLFADKSVLYTVQQIPIIFLQIFVEQDHITARRNSSRNRFFPFHGTVKANHRRSIRTDQTVKAELFSQKAGQKLR